MNIKGIKNSIIILLAVIVSAVGVCGLASCTSSAEVTVPKLVGLTQQSAEDKLDEVGLSYNIEHLHSTEIDEGLIIAQSAEADSTVDANTKITIIVSSGNQIYYPDLIGKTENNAKEILEELGLSLSVSSRQYSDTVKSGYVMSQSVVAQEKAHKGDIVSVVISKGVEQCSVPDVKGNKIATAKSKITKANLKYEIKYEYSSSVAKNKVIKQSVSAGKKVNKGTLVTITVSKGKKPAPKKNTSSSSTSSYVPPATTPPVQTPPKTSSSGSKPKTSSQDSGGFFVIY